MEAIVFISILFIINHNLSGQSRNIQGRVISEDFEVLPEVRIQNIDTILIGKTDIDGYFKINIPRETDKLLLSWIGMEWTTIQIPKNCDTLEIIMMYDGTYDFMSSRKIDNLRRKRFNKLSELHIKAFNKGIFKTEKPCHFREFEPIKPALDKIQEQMKLKREKINIAFKVLTVGDTIGIPYSSSYRYDGTDRTTLFVYSYVVEDSGFDCVIKGVITEKNKRKKGYNLIYKVTNLDMCDYDSIVNDGKEVSIGDSIAHNMKYFKVLAE